MVVVAVVVRVWVTDFVDVGPVTVWLLVVVVVVVVVDRFGGAADSVLVTVFVVLVAVFVVEVEAVLEPAAAAFAVAGFVVVLLARCVSVFDRLLAMV